MTTRPPEMRSTPGGLRCVYVWREGRCRRVGCYKLRMGQLCPDCINRTATIHSALSGAMAAGIVSRYKTGLRLDKTGQGSTDTFL